jgi:magnesium-transporting ATPase (P-type)
MIIWHSLSILDVVDKLQTDLERGLSAAATTAQLNRFGPQELVEQKRPSFWKHLLDQFLVIILIVAALISFGLGEWQPRSKCWQRRRRTSSTMVITSPSLHANWCRET